MILKILIFCITLLGVLYIMGTFPAVAVAVACTLIVGLFLLFKDTI